VPSEQSIYFHLLFTDFSDPQINETGVAECPSEMLTRYAREAGANLLIL
jgi:hypothetical protein